MMADDPQAHGTDDSDYRAAFEIARRQVADLTQQFHTELPGWAVFGPSNHQYSGVFIARLRLYYERLDRPAPTNVVLRASSLAEIRELLPSGLTHLRRQPHDDPHLVEVWLA